MVVYVEERSRRGAAVVVRGRTHGSTDRPRDRGVGGGGGGGGGGGPVRSVVGQAGRQAERVGRGLER